MSLRWFGDRPSDHYDGTAQPPGICEVPLETFTPALEQLAGYSEHLAVLGTSKGAEAALLLAAHDARIRTIAALSPTSVVWANVGPGLDGRESPPRSSWTRAGSPLPFVPYDQAWHDDRAAEAANSTSPGTPPDVTPGTTAPGPPAFRTLYEQSMTTYASLVPAARIPVESIRGEVLLSSGGDDQVWPSDAFARDILTRRSAHGLSTTHLTVPAAGHRLQLPGEELPGGGMAMARGGSAAADRELGELLWRRLAATLHLS
ncbi:acyl-CoA thioester hydrolase/BAAT C-terminal domain-containing protein [Kineococcus sp. SYSU DK006]|uniref:acyl-CoA thioester hydrolase/BAAT C-terminal domain-containing protein n=1 Tax=Kineococcus sp. SYSU DK006 TaxID=3383127 RepID=UPI003D7CE06B